MAAVREGCEGGAPPGDTKEGEVWWGQVVVQIGMTAGVVDMLTFGGVIRYWPLLMCRLALGLLASVNVATRSMVGDVTSVTEKVGTALPCTPRRCPALLSC